MPSQWLQIGKNYINFAFVAKVVDRGDHCVKIIYHDGVAESYEGADCADIMGRLYRLSTAQEAPCA